MTHPFTVIFDRLQATKGKLRWFNEKKKKKTFDVLTCHSWHNNLEWMTVLSPAA